MRLAFSLGLRLVRMVRVTIGESSMSMKGLTTTEVPGCLCLWVENIKLASLPAKLPAVHILKQHKDATEQSSHHASTPPRPIIPFPPLSISSHFQTKRSKRREDGFMHAKERVENTSHFETWRKKKTHSLQVCFITCLLCKIASRCNQSLQWQQTKKKS